MLRGLWKLTWLEIKIFLREPLGAIGTIGIPVLMFVALGRMFGPTAAIDSSRVPLFVTYDLPVFTGILILLNAVLSLVTIVSIYREGGILRRLRATPLRPYTILSAQVIVKLILNVITISLMVMAGRRYYPIYADVRVANFIIALGFATMSILSIGFLIASIVPSARFAQPIGALILYPMLAVSGLFFSIEALPPVVRLVARALPLTYAVSLLRGIWNGHAWLSHATDIAALVTIFAICTALSAKVFRWE
jgi:ABC-2 type transport system permease protein